MLLWITSLLAHYIHGFHVFQYITFRSVTSAITAFLLVFLMGPYFIRRLCKRQIGQMVRDDGPKRHLEKTGTPTMGGVLILFGIAVSTLLWSDLNNRFVWLALFVTLLFGFVGGIDDYRKITQKNSRGLPAKWKFFWQSLIGLTASVLLFYTATSQTQTELVIPFFKHIIPQLGILYIILAYFVIVGSSNAVNLTDGLDGLALLPTVLITVALGVFAYVAGNVNFAQYLTVPYIAGAGELVIFCSAVVGAGLGFLWYNTYPAQIFMGDVGSLGLGAALGIVAVVVRQEFVLLLMGGIFVAETVSVILQVLSFRLRGKRIFRMAPLHHHFELMGWPEPRVIVRFWIITVLLVLIGLSTLKLR